MRLQKKNVGVRGANKGKRRGQEKGGIKESALREKEVQKVAREKAYPVLRIGCLWEKPLV